MTFGSMRRLISLSTILTRRIYTNITAPSTRKESTMTKHKYDFDLIVLGSGGGGSVAALIAAGAGKRVALVEPGDMGGECPNYGCVPTKALLHAAGIYDAAKHGQLFGI